MSDMNAIKITVETTVDGSSEKIWEMWNLPEHITKWCSASPDWHAPKASNDLKQGGRFETRMEARDGSFGFDFGGIYDEVRKHEFIKYTMDDGRKNEITFANTGSGVHVTETFDAETQNPVDMQQAGWQAILDNFKKYVESH